MKITDLSPIFHSDSFVLQLSLDLMNVCSTKSHKIKFEMISIAFIGCADRITSVIESNKNFRFPKSTSKTGLAIGNFC